MTTAQTRYSGAVRKALDIIAETSDGDRSDKLFRAGVHMGKFAHWTCADPGIAQRLLSHAQASGADHSALGHIERGITEGRRKPNTEPADRDEAHETETLAQLLDRKRISRGVIAAFALREYRGAAYYPCPPMEADRVRVLTRPSQIKWTKPLKGVPVQLPYGMAQLRGDGPVYVVNGETSVWAAWSAGVDAVCFCRGEGAAPSETQARALADTSRPIRVVYDLDAAGERGSSKVVSALRAAGCADVVGLLLPDSLGAKGDVNDLWIQSRGDATTFTACLESLPERLPPSKTITQPDLPEQEPPAPLDLLTRACPGIPAPGGVKVPFGYLISSEGVWRQAKDDEDEPRLICGGPVAVVGYSRDKDTQSMTCTIAYRRPHDPMWYTHECDRATLMEARKVSSLSAVGVPVTSGQAAGLVQYFAASEAALSEGGLSVSVTTSVMGWHGNTFVRGTHSHGDAPRLRVPTDSALRTLAESIGISGEWETWKARVWSECATRPTLRLMIAAAVVPAIMSIIECPAFAVDICGVTSQGKTTAMFVAASVWGSPKFRETWDTTQVGVETMCNMNRCMPMLLDDTREQTNPAVCAHVVFAIVSGKGRKRGAANGGMRATAAFETVILSTGEGPLKDMAQIGGLAARCICVWGSPMGKKSSENAAVARALKEATRYHYGHIGAAVVDHLIRMTADERAELRQRYARYVEWFTLRATGGSDVADRLAEYAAAIAVAGKLIAKVMGLPLSTVWVTPEIWAAVSESSATADRATAALYDLHTHVYQHADQIYRAPGRGRVPRGTEPPEPSTPPRGWLAHLTKDDLQLLSVPRGEAQSILERLGYNHNEVVSAWKERGWLRTESGRTTANVTIAGHALKCYSFTAAAMRVTQEQEPREPGCDDDAADVKSGVIPF